MVRNIFLLLVVVTSVLGSASIREVVNDLVDDRSYDKTEIPERGSKGKLSVDTDKVNVLLYAENLLPNALGKPVVVRVEASIQDVYDFDELKHQVTLRMILRQKWVDKRLSFDSNKVEGSNELTLDHEQSDKVWRPDTFIRNERSLVHHGFSKPNEYIRVDSQGNVMRSERITVTIGCALNLRWFPFDQNICSMDFESYIYKANDVTYKWNRNLSGKPVIWISKETAQSVRHEITAFQGKDIMIPTPSGNYSRAALQISLKRLSFRYLLEVYFPATAIPVVAFITMCVGALEFRVLMSTICMFMMVTYAIIFRLSHVTVDYKTALDFYVFNSSVTVFNVVLVNFLMYYLLKPKVSPTQMRMRQLNGSREEGKGILADEESAADDTGNTPSTPRFPNKTTELLFKFIETSYVTMPIFFVVFNIIYWPVVLIASSGTPEDFFIVEPRGLD